MSPSPRVAGIGEATLATGRRILTAAKLVTWEWCVIPPKFLLRDVPLLEAAIAGLEEPTVRKGTVIVRRPEDRKLVIEWLDRHLRSVNREGLSRFANEPAAMPWPFWRPWGEDSAGAPVRLQTIKNIASILVAHGVVDRDGRPATSTHWDRIELELSLLGRRGDIVNGPVGVVTDEFREFQEVVRTLRRFLKGRDDAKLVAKGIAKALIPVHDLVRPRRGLSVPKSPTQGDDPRDQCVAKLLQGVSKDLPPGATRPHLLTGWIIVMFKVLNLRAGKHSDDSVIRLSRGRIGRK